HVTGVQPGALPIYEHEQQERHERQQEGQLDRGLAGVPGRPRSARPGRPGPAPPGPPPAVPAGPAPGHEPRAPAPAWRWGAPLGGERGAHNDAARRSSTDSNRSVKAPVPPAQAMTPRAMPPAARMTRPYSAVA